MPLTENDVQRFEEIMNRVRDARDQRFSIPNRDEEQIKKILDNAERRARIAHEELVETKRFYGKG